MIEVNYSGDRTLNFTGKKQIKIINGKEPKP